MIPQPDNSFITTVYRKSTHTDLYLQLDSHHKLAATISVINTLTHRAKTVCSSHQFLKEEGDLPTKALQKCKCTVWALNSTNFKQKKSNRPNKGFNNIRNDPAFNNTKPHIVLPYIKGLSKSCKNICSKHDIQMHFRGGRTIKDLLVDHKNRDSILQKSGVIYRYKCGRVDCEDEYIGQLVTPLQKDSKNT